MLTAAQVAERLGLSKRKVYELAQSGKVPCFRFGDAVRFEPADVEAFKNSCRSDGTRATSAGAMSSTAVFKAGANELLAYFQRAGVAPRLTPTIAPKARASTPLRLASNKQTS